MIFPTISNTKASFYLVLLAALFIMPSCGKVLYPNFMFKKQKDDNVDIIMVKRDQLVDEYIIQPFDQFTVAVFSREGMDLIDVLGGGRGAGNIGGAAGALRMGNLGIQYLVDKNGYVNLPILGDFYVDSLSERELEEKLEKEYGYYFVDPYVVVTVTNRRVFLFKGPTASVVQLNESPTNLLEVLALSGGLGADLKAYDIKIIRGDLSDPEVYKVDLSTFAGLKEGELLVQTNDIVYVEQRRRVVRDSSRELATLLSSVTILLSTISLFIAIKNINGN